MARITLEVLDGADRGRVYGELATPVSVGREEGNNVQLNDERVSRYHLKIQEDQGKVVLTDLESTNGTKVNGEEVKLRILRFGDLISIGRSMLKYGTKEQIEARLARQRGQHQHPTGTMGEDDAPGEDDPAAFDFEVGASGAGATNQLDADSSAGPPELPKRLSPGQAAQLAELLEYLHVRVRHLLNSVKMDADNDVAQLDGRAWQGLVEIQTRLAVYLRQIGDPPSD